MRISGGTYAALGVLLNVVACGSETSTLVVEVRTDLVPVLEMSGVGVDLAGRGAEGEWDFFMTATLSQDWAAGVQIFEETGLSTGPVSFRVGADDLDGRTLVERSVRGELSEGPRTIVVLLTSDCVPVECPSEDAAACLGGRCVSPECSEDDPATCGVRECAAAEECPTSPVECAEAACTGSGACVLMPRAGACAAGEVCSFEEGCVPVARDVDGGA